MATLVIVDRIPSLALEQINWVVEKQEGGWELTIHTNDPDGGWTFGGVTATTYGKHMGKVVTASEISAAVLASNKDQVIANCLEIYYDSYYLPALKLLENFWKEANIGALETYELSCIINLGEAAFEAIVNETKNYDDPEDFQHAWEDHYFSIVKQNAEAWKAWGLNCSHLAIASDPIAATKQMVAEMPATLRAEYLHGWINRVRTAMKQAGDTTS